MNGRYWMFRAVPVLVAINVGIFLYESLLGPVEKRQFLAWYALSADGLSAGRWWQFGTHAFLHGGWLHLILNMAGLWVPGRIVERVMGTGRFLALYVISAVAGGLAQVVLTGGGIPLIGASGAVCGVVLAFTTMFPEAQRVFLIFFVLPLRLRAKYLGWALMGMSLLFLILNFEPWIGHAAHFGGCVAGYLFTRLSGYGTPTFVERWFLKTEPQAS